MSTLCKITGAGKRDIFMIDGKRVGSDLYHSYETFLRMYFSPSSLHRFTKKGRDYSFISYS